MRGRLFDSGRILFSFVFFFYFQKKAHDLSTTPFIYEVDSFFSFVSDFFYLTAKIAHPAYNPCELSVKAVLVHDIKAVVCHLEIDENFDELGPDIHENFDGFAV